jgi:hypothetical protein
LFKELFNKIVLRFLPGEVETDYFGFFGDITVDFLAGDLPLF